MGEAPPLALEPPADDLPPFATPPVALPPVAVELLNEVPPAGAAPPLGDLPPVGAAPPVDDLPPIGETAAPPVAATPPVGFTPPPLGAPPVPASPPVFVTSLPTCTAPPVSAGVLDAKVPPPEAEFDPSDDELPEHPPAVINAKPKPNTPCRQLTLRMVTRYLLRKRGMPRLGAGGDKTVTWMYARPYNCGDEIVRN